MNPLSWILKAISPQRYLGATIGERAGISNGPLPRPFNPQRVARAFHSWAYAAAMLNANAFASTPKRLFARVRPGLKPNFGTRKISKQLVRYFAGNGQTQPSRAVMAKFAQFGGDVIEITDVHPALEILRTINPYFNGFEIEQLRMLDLQFTGNAYLHVLTDASGVPAELWRMPPSMTEVIQSKTEYVGGYLYGGSTNKEKFAPDEVIHFKLPNPNNLFYGMGWVEAAWKSLGLHDSKRELDLAKFDNYARPDWLLSIPGANSAAADKLEKTFSEKFTGSEGRKRRFLAVSADVKAQALQWDVQESGTPTRIIEEIAAVSGVPIAMLLSNDPNRASSQTARLGWYRNTIQPYCRLDEEKLNEKWIPRFEDGEDLLIAHDPANFEDQTANANRVSNLVKSGIFTPNEGRAELDYPPHPNGDALFSPVGATGGGPDQSSREGNDNADDR